MGIGQATSDYSILVLCIVLAHRMVLCYCNAQSNPIMCVRVRTLLQHTSVQAVWFATTQAVPGTACGAPPVM
jgi:hypothetical protein